MVEKEKNFLRILQMTGGDTGGVFKHVADLSKGLKESGHKVFIACEHSSRIKEFENVCDTFVIDFHEVRPSKILKNIRFLKKIIMDNKIDIVHCHYRTAGLYMYVLQKITKVPYVWTNHLLNIPSDFIHRITTKYGSKAIAIGIDSKEFMKEKLNIPEEDIEIINHGIILNQSPLEDKQETLNRYGINSEEKVILLLGRLERVKGHIFLLNALKEMKNIKILFAGNGSDEYKKEIIDSAALNSLENEIVFTGFTNPQNLLQIADLMVLPSQNEGFAIAAIEAFDKMVPVIRTKTGGYSDMSDICIGVDYGDEGKLREAVEYVLCDSQAVKNMIFRAKEKVEIMFGYDNMIKHIEELYSEIVANFKKE